MLAGVLDWIGELTDRLADWSSNWWFLGVILGIAFLDSVIPIVPSETTVIVGGVAVATDIAPYDLWMVIAVGAAGAFLGDNLAYSIGHAFAPRFDRRAARNPGFARRVQWANTQIRRRGGLLLITARFIPGGRTALTLSSGITRQSRWWFVRWIFVASLIWAGYAAGLARIIGEGFDDNHTAAFWIAFGAALTINLLIELIRHGAKKRAARRVAVSALAPPS
jgi:membrane protein DedA with SNARE-associated domain